MCGIVGLLGVDGGVDLSGAAARMCAAVAHRGPDAGAVWTDAAAGVALGHRRLSVLDLSESGAQPMHSASGRFVLSFNGEVYNHADLRAMLGGVAFRGRSDTEVLLAAVERWGVRGAVERAVGMFALACWDRRARTLTLARDRIGEKPLYYGWVGGTVVFGSELRALRAFPGWVGEIDRRALDLLLRHGYVPAPHAIYRNVHKLLPGTLLTIGAGDRRGAGALPAPEPYWSARDAFTGGDGATPVVSDEEAVDELDRLLRRAVREQMVADVPLGVFLSGGIDSTLVTALMQAQSARPVRTFTIGFDDPALDEARFARDVAAHLGTAHTELYVSGADALAAIPLLPGLLDEPFADASQIPMLVVAGLARRDVTVALSGDGGDELFGGYPRYRDGLRLGAWLDRVPPAVRRLAGLTVDAAAAGAVWAAASRVRRRGMDGARRGATEPALRARLVSLARRLGAPSPEERYFVSQAQWKARRSLVQGLADATAPLTTADRWAPLGASPEMMMYQDLVSYLPDDILVKVDRATMAHGLEARAPFLDHRVVEFAARLPWSLKLRGGQGKWLPRQLLYRHVPPALVERPKRGFGPPVRAWLRGPLRDWAEALLDERRLRREGYLDAARVRWLWAQHQAGAGHWTEVLWAALMFQAWLERAEAPSAGGGDPVVGHAGAPLAPTVPDAEPALPAGR